MADGIHTLAESLSNQDVAYKNCVETNAFTNAGGVVSGDTKLNVGSDLVRRLGCNNLTTGKKFTLLLGTNTNILSYFLSDPQLPVAAPVKITRKPSKEAGIRRNAIFYNT